MASLFARKSAVFVSTDISCASIDSRMRGIRRKLRWYAKKLGRYALALIASGSGWLALRSLLSKGPRVRVLMYHRFRDEPGDPYSVSISQFTRQMRWLAEKGLAISLSDLLAFLSGEKDLPDGSVLVTI